MFCEPVHIRIVNHDDRLLWPMMNVACKPRSMPPLSCVREMNQTHHPGPRWSGDLYPEYKARPRAGNKAATNKSHALSLKPWVT